MTVPPAALTPGHGQAGKGLSTILLCFSAAPERQWLCGMQALVLCSWAHLTSVSIFGLPTQTQAAKDEQVLPGGGFVCYKHLSSC